jgi:hypothetical protein
MCLGKVSLLAHILFIYLRVHICNHRYVSVLRSCQHAGYLSVTASLMRPMCLPMLLLPAA